MTKDSAEKIAKAKEEQDTKNATQDKKNEQTGQKNESGKQENSATAQRVEAKSDKKETTVAANDKLLDSLNGDAPPATASKPDKSDHAKPVVAKPQNATVSAKKLSQPKV